MSTKLALLRNTGKNGRTMTITQFGSRDYGLMLQVTQGIGGQTTPGYIELTKKDALALCDEIIKWVIDQT